MFKRLIASLVCSAFIFSNFQYVYAQDFSINQLPVPGTMVGESAPFSPLALKGLVVNPLKPLEFQFIVDTGRGPQDTASVKEQANQLVKYFLAGLTIPEGDLWVNLSPYEKDRMVPEALGQTDLGRDLLAQDYILKQLTASLIYPEKDLGKEFWSRVYAKAQQQFGTTNVPVNTFNKVWILPDQAQVFENGNAAYVTKSTLKVMLDEDYLAKQKHMIVHNDTGSSIGANIVREIVLPEIEKEVNAGKNFAPLRQIYQALILAKWYKETIQNGLLDAVYTNKNKVAGVNLNDLAVKEEIYQRYLKAYRKGAFNYIKEDPTPDGQVVPRKYFSGGEVMVIHLDKHGTVNDIGRSDGAMISFTVGLIATGSVIAGGLALRSRIEKVNKENIEQTRMMGNLDLDPVVIRFIKANWRELKKSFTERIIHKIVHEVGTTTSAGADYTTNVNPFDHIVSDTIVFTGNVKDSKPSFSGNYSGPIEGYASLSGGVESSNEETEYREQVELDELAMRDFLKGLTVENAKERIQDKISAQDAAMFARARIAGWKLTDNVDKIAVMLSNRNEGVRKSAEKALAKLRASKERMVDAYIAVLSSGSMNARINAVNKLADLDAKRAVKPLASLLNEAEKNKSYEEYNQISGQLNKMGSAEGRWLYSYHRSTEPAAQGWVLEKVKRSDAAMLQTPGTGEFNSYSIANDILTKSSNSGETINPARVRRLGAALDLAHSFIEMQRDIPVEEINQKIRDLTVAKSFFVQALSYFLYSPVEKEQVRTASLIYNMYLDSNNASEKDSLRVLFKSASRIIDKLNGVPNTDADQAMLSRMPLLVSMESVQEVKGMKTDEAMLGSLGADTTFVVIGLGAAIALSSQFRAKKRLKLIEALRNPDQTVTFNYIKNNFGRNAYGWLKQIKYTPDEPRLMAGLIKAMAEFSHSTDEVAETWSFMEELDYEHEDGFMRTATAWAQDRLVRKGSKDSAMLQAPSLAENGGIDLNQINVNRHGRTVNVQFDPAQLNQLMQDGFEGFTPVIISMTPISSPLLLLGIGPANISK